VDLHHRKRETLSASFLCFPLRVFDLILYMYPWISESKISLSRLFLCYYAVGIMGSSSSISCRYYCKGSNIGLGEAPSNPLVFPLASFSHTNLRPRPMTALQITPDQKSHRRIRVTQGNQSPTHSSLSKDCVTCIAISLLGM
jgi:hypothetical protein